MQQTKKNDDKNYSLTFLNHQLKIVCPLKFLQEVFFIVVVIVVIEWK